MTTSTAPRQPATLESLIDGVADDPGHDGTRIRWNDGAVVALDPDGTAAQAGHREQLLVESACMGDDEALELLCRKEWYGVYHLAAQAVTDVAEAEELTQEVFARAIASLSRFRYMGVPFHSYLAQITRNLLRDRWRAAQGRPEMATDDEIPDFPAPEPEPEPIVLAADERHLLVDALGRLPRRYREVLYLRLLEGRTASEIGVEWGRTPESVRQIQHRALLALRAEMAGAGTR